MFGYRELGHFPGAYLTCAAQAPDGTVYVGRWADREGPGIWIPSAVPGLYTLAAGVFTPQPHFADGARWVNAMHADTEGIWAAGALLAPGTRAVATLWRIEGGEVVAEFLADFSPAIGLEAWEVEVWGEEVCVAGNLWVAKKGETKLVNLAPGLVLGFQASLLAQRDRLHWLQEGAGGGQGGIDATMQWWDGDRLQQAESALIPWANCLATFEGRVWGVRNIGVSVPAGTMRPTPIAGAYQELVWFDGYGWQAVAAWEPSAGLYSRLCALHGGLYMFGEVWGDPPYGDPPGQPCVGNFDGRNLELGRPWGYYPARIVTIPRPDNGQERGVLFVADTIYPTQQELSSLCFGTRVVAAGLDVAIFEVHAEVSGGGTESRPSIHEVRAEVSGGEPETAPVIHEVRAEFSDGAEGPRRIAIFEVHAEVSGGGMESRPSIYEIRAETSGGGAETRPSIHEIRVETSGGPGMEPILWLVKEEETDVVGILVTMAGLPAEDRGVTVIARFGREHLPVDDWASYQAVPINVKTPVDEPGRTARIGVIQRRGGPEQAAVGVVLLTE